MRTLSFFLAALALASSGCDRDLGDCNLDGTTPGGGEVDGPAAFDVVYRITDGTPMYEGQALVQSTCGDSTFCHAPAATGANRFGAPAGLNFDVSLVCTESLSGCQSDPPYEDRVNRFDDNQTEIRNWAGGIIQEIRAGSMPPGAAGQRVANTTPWLRPDGSELPSIDSSDAREIVRNWLACGAPAVGRTEPPPTQAEQLQPCGTSDEEVICVYSGPAGALPDPTWTDIYWNVIFTQCVFCHGPANTNTDQNPDNPFGGDIPGGASADALTVLDLSGTDVVDTTDWAEDTYSRVVDASTSTAGPCAGQGFVIESSDGEGSIMVQKMRGTQTCGDSMPIGALLPAPLVDVVAEWADLGAPLN